MENNEENVIENISIDCVIYGFDNGKLKLLLKQCGEGIVQGQWALPGGFILDSEDMDDSAYRILSASTGVSDIYLDQFRTFGKKDRFPLRRVFTVAYFALVKPEEYEILPGYTADDVQWYDVTEVPPLIFDHGDIAKQGLRHLKDKVKHEPVGFNLLPKEFTMRQLQSLYEVILEKKLESVNFRSSILKTELLKKVEREKDDTSFSNYYSFDDEMCKKFVEEGHVFEI